MVVDFFSAIAVVDIVTTAEEVEKNGVEIRLDEQPIAKDTSSNDEFDVVATEPPVAQEEMATEEEAKKEELVHELVEAIAAEINKEEETVTEEEAKKEEADSEKSVQNQEEEQPIAKDVYSNDEFDVVATEPATSVNGREKEDEEKKEFVELIETEIKKEEETLTEEEAEVATEPPGKVNETEKEDEAKKEEEVHELVEAIAAEIQKEGESPELVAEVPEVKETAVIAEKDSGADVVTTDNVEKAEADNEAKSMAEEANDDKSQRINEEKEAPPVSREQSSPPIEEEVKEDDRKGEVKEENLVENGQTTTATVIDWSKEPLPDGWERKFQEQQKRVSILSSFFCFCFHFN
jgi:pilus assembly protein FimV